MKVNVPPMIHHETVLVLVNGTTQYRARFERYIGQDKVEVTVEDEGGCSIFSLRDVQRLVPRGP